MTSEIRANTLKNRVGLGTVSYTNTGIIVSGIVTANSFSGPYNGTDIVGTGITLTSTDAGSAAGPEVKLFRNSASPANADYLGQLKFAGESSTGVERNYAKITGKILDVTNGSEDGILEFAHIKGGSQTITGRWRSDSLQLLNDTNLSVAGNTTLTGDIDVDGHTNLDNVSVAGVSTFTGQLNAGVVEVNSTINVIGESTFRDRIQLVDSAPEILLSVPSGGLDSRILNDGSGNLIIGHGINSDTPTERLRIGSNGDIYIRKAETGASKGSAALEFYGTTSGSLDRDQAKIESSPHTSNTNAGNLDFYTQTVVGNNLSLRMRIDGAGNIGINETAPSEKLQIDGDILLGGQANASESNYAIKFEYNNHQFAKIVGDGRDQSGYGDIDFYTSSSSGVSNLTQRMSIRADGKIGIGNFLTAAPASRLDVRDTSTTSYPFTSADSGTYSYSPYPHELQIRNNTTGTTDGFTGIHFHAGERSAGGRQGTARISAVYKGEYKADLVFATRNTSFREKLRITSGGQLIMTNAATQTFFDFSTTNNNTRGVISVAGKDSSGDAVTVKIGGFGDTDRGEIFTHSNHGLGFATNNAATQMMLDTSGRLRIGNTSITTSSGADDLIVGTTSGERGITIFSGNDSNGNIYFGDTNTSGTGNRMGSIRYVHSDGSNSNYMRFSTNGNLERLRINSDGQIHKRQDTTNRTSLKTYSGEGLWFDHYQLQDSGTYRRYADIVSAGDGSWGSYMRFFTMNDSGSPTERLRIQKDGGVYMRTQGGFTNEAGNLSSGVGYDNRTRLYPYWVSETGACRFHFSATANPGIGQPRFWLFTNGTNHLTGKIEIGMNQRTNSPNNARFRNHQSTWQVAMYGEGDNDGSGMRYNYQEGTQRGSTTTTSYGDYYVSSNGSSHYGTNDNQYQDGYGGWYWKMNNGSDVQGHRFHFDCYFSGGGFSTWYMYIDQ